MKRACAAQSNIRICRVRIRFGSSFKSGTADQYTRSEDESATDQHLHSRREWRSFHVAMANPSDDSQFDQHDDERNDESRLKV